MSTIHVKKSRKLTCKVIPKGDVHPELWVGADRKWREVPTYRLRKVQHNKVHSLASRLNVDRLIWLLQPRNETQRRTAKKRLMKRQEARKRKRKLVEEGIVYNFDKVGYVSGPTPYAMADQNMAHEQIIVYRLRNNLSNGH
jgi:nucleolar protein 15